MSTPSPWAHPPKPPRKPSRLGHFLWLAALIGIGVLIWALVEFFPGRATTPSDTASIVQLVAILAVMSSGLLFVKDWDLKKKAKQILAWAGIAGVLMLGFSFQEPLLSLFNRLRSEIIPGTAIQTGPREMTISESDGGNYFLFGTVNGARVLFMVDTGASDIVLAPADARRAGIDTGALTYIQAYQTANGTAGGARVKVQELTAGKIAFSNVTVSVNQVEMNGSLLGMTFLRRLKSFEFRDRKLTLRW